MTSVPSGLLPSPHLARSGRRDPPRCNGRRRRGPPVEVWASLEYSSRHSWVTVPSADAGRWTREALVSTTDPFLMAVSRFRGQRLIDEGGPGRSTPPLGLVRLPSLPVAAARLTLHAARAGPHHPPALGVDRGLYCTTTDFSLLRIRISLKDLNTSLLIIQIQSLPWRCWIKGVRIGNEFTSDSSLQLS